MRMQLTDIQGQLGDSEQGLAGELGHVRVELRCLLSELNKFREQHKVGVCELGSHLKEQVVLLKQLVAQSDTDSRGAQDAMSLYSPSGKSEDSPEKSVAVEAGPKVAKAVDAGTVIAKPIPYHMVAVDLTPKPVSSMAVPKKGAVAGKKG